MKDQDQRPMNCDRVRQEIPALLYGELEPEVKEAVEQHLDSCTACSAERDKHRQTMLLLDRWPVAEPPAMPEFPLPRAASQQPVRAGVLRLLRPVIFGAAAAVLMFGALMLVVADARYADGRLVVTLGQGSVPTDHTSKVAPSHTASAQMREIAQFECDRRIEGMLELLGGRLDELDRRHERNRQLLARAVDVQRERDRLQQQSAMEGLARGFGQEIHTLIESGGVIPASYIQRQRRD
ncbi:MAG: anti-sigma factor family protein [Planctomycetota bacterium]|jgi:hypothetical protein